MSEPILVHPSAISGITYSIYPRVLHIKSDEPLAYISSAVVGGGMGWTRHILNWNVPSDYFSETPAEDLNQIAAGLALPYPFVGMMTAVLIERVQICVERRDDCTVVVFATVGVRNRVAAGVTPAYDEPIGTINLIVLTDADLTPAARVNLVLTATEAKTLVLVENDLRAPHGGYATGTGSDALVIASTQRGARFDYGGPLTPIGAAVGRAVRRAVQQGLAL